MNRLQEVLEARRWVVVGISLLVITGSAWYLHYTQRRVIPAGTGFLGRMIAAEAEKRLPAGSAVVVIDLDTGPMVGHSADVAEFYRTAKRLKVLALERLTARAADGSPAPISPQTVAEGFRGTDYRLLLDRYPQVTAFISFAGAPRLESAEIEQLPPNRPRMIALEFMPVAEGDSPLVIGAEFRPNFRPEWFAAGKIEVLIVPRGEPKDTGVDAPLGTPAWFDRYYEVLTRPKSAGA